MLYEALQVLATEVNNFLESETLSRDVIIGNIAMLDSEQPDDDTSMEDKVVLTLLTMDEEATLRNFPNMRVNGTSVSYRNNRVNLNLYVLFSGNKKKYANSLIYVSKVLEFFQGKNLFTQSNTSYDREKPYLKELKDFRFTMELYTPTFEDLNYIWGTLGGKQLPSALYKLSLVIIEEDNTVKESALIVEDSGVFSSYGKLPPDGYIEDDDDLNP